MIIPNPALKSLLISSSIIAFQSFAMLSSYSYGANSMKDLIQNLLAEGVIKSNIVASTMTSVDRINYSNRSPYTDSPQDIGFSATISAPHMHAFVLEYLLPVIRRDDSKILDVGCGSGYLTAAFARLNPSSTVYGIDYIPGLVELSRANINKKDDDLITSNRVKLSVGDGWNGLPEHAPFDAIHVGAAAETFPNALAEQLKVGGFMIVPVGSQYDHQVLKMVKRLQASGPDAFLVQDMMGVRYVPLVNSNKP